MCVYIYIHIQTSLSFRWTRATTGSSPTPRPRAELSAGRAHSSAPLARLDFNHCCSILYYITVQCSMCY